MYSCVQCYAILWTSAGHVRLHTRLRCQSIRLWATGLLYGNRFSHCEVELWAVTDEASKVHKNTHIDKWPTSGVELYHTVEEMHMYFIVTIF